jgi:hypothetical protein
MPPTFIMCKPVRLGAAGVVSDERPCSKCGVKCWVSPSSADVIATDPTVAILCLSCASVFVAGEVDAGRGVDIAVAPGAMDEVAAALRGKEHN